ncbi:MAG: 3-phosphoshikimate 1-carboxyvinyltransferase, partial [Clostridia bacterium]
TGTLDVKESGSTLRFLLPIVAAIGGDFEFICKGRLIDRPNDELYSVLRTHGISISHGKTIKLSGKLSSGKFEINGNVSSQYISGLLMALPTLEFDSEIVLKSKLSSENYIDITLEVLEKFGIEIQKTPSGYKILGNQKYVATENLVVDGDWSNSAFFLVYSAINGGVKVSNLDINSKQGDRQILDILQKIGIKVQIENNTVTVKKKAIKPLEIDVDNIIDLTPILAVLCACAKGESVLKNIKRLRLKESDRVKSTIEMLKSVGIEAFEQGDAIHIVGGEIHGGIVNSYNDHRIVMASAIAGLLSNDCVTIENAEAANKSYPTFFEDIKALGGIIDVKI